MPDFSHVTRAHVTDPGLKILRRPYNYDGVPDAAGHPDAGLIGALGTGLGLRAGLAAVLDVGDDHVVQSADVEADAVARLLVIGLE